MRGIEAMEMSAQAPFAPALAVPAAVPAVGVDLPLEPPAEIGLDAQATTRRRSAAARWAQTCLGVDAATLAAAAVAAMAEVGVAGLTLTFDWWPVLFVALTLALFHSRGLYQLRVRTALLDDVRRIVGAVTVAAALVIALRALLAPGAPVDPTVLRAWVFAVVYATGGRIGLYRSQAKAHAAGEATRQTLILGAGRVGRVVARRLLADPSLGLRPVGFVDAAPLVGEDDELEVPVLGTPDEIERIVERYAIDHVLVTFTSDRDESVLQRVNAVAALGATVSIVPRLFEKVPERVTVEHLGGIALLTPHATNPRGLRMAVKYAVDRVVAAVLVLLAAPVLLACAAAVYVSMGRPIFFRQIRVGRDGREFGILKFRSMKLPTPEELEAQARAIAEGLPGGVEGVDRRTRVGTFLRKTSLDELPQLLNVLRGEMSIVGPRPERPEFVERFEDTIYRYPERHRVKAGITGWAQVHGLRGKTSIEDRAEWDNWYVENCSLWLDAKILLRTAAAVVAAFRDVE